MTDFNYNQLPIELLKEEAARIDEQVNELMDRRVLVAKAIGKKALETTTDFPPTLFTY